VVDKVRVQKSLAAAYVVYPPFVIKDPSTGQLSGYFIEMMEEISKYGDFKVNYEEAKWGTMVAGLEQNRYDVVVSGIFPTIPRALSVTFAKPIMYVGLSAIVDAKSQINWVTSALSDPKLRIAVVNGEVGQEYVKRFLPAQKPISLDTSDLSRAGLEVLQGRADIAIAESITCVEFAQRNPKVKAIFTEIPLQVYGSTFMIRSGDPDWLAFLNTSIEFLESSGVIDKLESKYKSRPGLWLSRSKPWQ